jgi:protein tyrosine phosphatase (PTP) superfamily phosphohydrolase (DUF442 family)
MYLRNTSFTAFFAFTVFTLPALAGSTPGIRNFDHVDSNVYRGGQPTAEGFRYLSGLGVKTVIDLRESGERSQAEERIVTGAGMKYVNVPMTGLTPPGPDEITRILDLLEDPSTGPTFVHCQRGADRTGAVIAAYRIDHDRWDNARALRDAKAHDMSFFQLPRENFIRHFQARNTAPPDRPALLSSTALSATAVVTK